MKFSLLAASLVATLVPFVAAGDSKAFKLRVPQNGPSEVAGKYVVKNENNGSPYLTIGGNGSEWTAVLKDGSAGEIVDANDATAPLWLRPTHGTPFYFVRYGGNPLDDAVPALVQYKDWNINTVPATNAKSSRQDTYTLKYGGDSWASTQWTACGGADGTWNIYYSGRNEALNCVENFDMEVVYV